MAETIGVLNIILSAEDQASKTLEAVGRSVGDLGESIGNTLKKNVVGLGAAFGALSGVVVSSIGAFDEAQNVAAQLSQALKATGNEMGFTTDEILKMSAALQQQSTASDEAITSAATLFVRFGNIGKEALPKATQAALDLSAAMGTDLQTAAQQLGVALSQPAEGVGRLTRQIPSLKGELGDLIVATAKSGDVAKAQDLLLKAVSDTMGGAALTKSKSLSGQFEILKNNVNDLQETLGKGLVEALSKSVGGMDNLNNKVLQVNGYLQAHHDILLALAATLLIVTAAFGILFVAALAAAAGVSLAFVGTIGLVIGAIAFLATMALQHTQEIGLFFTNLGITIQTALTNVGTMITTFVTNIVASFTAFVAQVQFINDNLWTVIIPTAIGYLAGYLAVIIPEMINNVVLWFTGLPISVGLVMDDMAIRVTTAINTLAAWLFAELAQWPARTTAALAAIPGIAATMWATFKENTRIALDATWSIITTFYDKIVGALNSIKSAAEAAFNAVSKGFQAGVAAATGKKFQYGGFVNETGLALLHQGEFVVSNDMQSGRACTPFTVENKYNQPISINVAQAQGDSDYDALSYRIQWILRNSR